MSGVLPHPSWRRVWPLRALPTLGGKSAGHGVATGPKASINPARPDARVAWASVKGSGGGGIAPPTGGGRGRGEAPYIVGLLAELVGPFPRPRPSRRAAALGLELGGGRIALLTSDRLFSPFNKVCALGSGIELGGGMSGIADDGASCVAVFASKPGAACACGPGATGPSPVL